MAKSIYICSRTGLSQPPLEKLEILCERITPDHSPADYQIKENNHGALAVIGPNHGTVIRKHSLLLGHLFGPHESWSTPLTGIPDGSFALFRQDNTHLEVVSDPSGSHTIWYYKDEYHFIASTSQRAIIGCLSTFKFDERVIPWMLSTGTLGPEFSWDQRLSRLPPDSSVVLNKNSWSITLRINRPDFTEASENKNELRKSLRNTLREVVSDLELNRDDIVLPLSGGYDSRALLLFFEKLDDAPAVKKAITWGEAGALRKNGNDAQIARRLANHFNIPHEYFVLDDNQLDFDKFIDRFLVCGEGRVDHISGYLDNFKLWKNLSDEGLHTMVRGDEGFGWHQVSSPLTVRLSVGCGLCSDFANLKNLQSYGVAPQQLPDHLRRQTDETLSTWRDRLYHQYRIPVVMAALSDLKYSYVEEIKPWLSRRILREVRRLSDKSRTEKRLFAELINRLGPDIPIARSAANPSRADILRQPRIAQLLARNLRTKRARSLFPPEFLKSLAVESTSDKGETSNSSLLTRIKKVAKEVIPRSVKSRIRDYVARPRIDDNILAFRVLLVTKTHALLQDDSREVFPDGLSISRKQPVTEEQISDGARSRTHTSTSELEN